MPRLLLKTTKHGKGVIAAEPIKAGDFIIEFRGKKYYRWQEKKYPAMNAPFNHFLQIGKHVYLGPTRTLDNYINHSCDPNSGFKIGRRALLYAIRDIKKGEEITFDYSTTMYKEKKWKMTCDCGAKNCRKTIKEFLLLSKNVQRRYIKLGVVPNYILGARKILLNAKTRPPTLPHRGKRYHRP